VELLNAYGQLLSNCGKLSSSFCNKRDCFLLLEVTTELLMRQGQRRMPNM
jgi:hypothetical protein